MAAEQVLPDFQARKLIDAVVGIVVEAAKDGAEVTLPGPGTFKFWRACPSRYPAWIAPSLRTAGLASAAADRVGTPHPA